MNLSNILHVLSHDLKIENNSALLMIQYIIDDIEYNNTNNIKDNILLLKTTYLRLVAVIDSLVNEME